MNVERINLLDLQKEELTPQEKEEIYGKKIEKQNIGPDEADKIEEGFLAKNEVENNKKSKEIKMTQKKNEERGIEFFKKEIARLKKEIEKINNKKEKDPGNENLESRSTELEEILKKAEEELTEIRYGDSEIEKIANKEAEEVTSITIPDDKERRRRLELKLESYKEGGDDSRAIILGLVLEEGRIDIKTIMGKVKEAVGDKFNHFEFVSDYRIIKDYCETGGENVSGGGLPEVPVEEDIESKIAEAQRGAEALKEVTDEKIGKTVSEVEKEPSVIEAEEGKKIEEKPVVSEEGETLVEEEPVIKSAEPTETEAGRSWEEIGERAGGAEEVIKGMEAKVFEKIERVEENPDIPKHEKEKAVFSLGIKEDKLDAVRLTTEMAQLKAEEFGLKEGIKRVELRLKEEGLDEAEAIKLQEELKELKIERHKIIRETTRLAIEKRNGLESLKLSIEAAVANQNLKISKWEKGAGEEKEGFVSRLAGAIKKSFSKEAGTETPTPIEEESEKKKGIFARIKGMFSREKEENENEIGEEFEKGQQVVVKRTDGTIEHDWKVYNREGDKIIVRKLNERKEKVIDKNILAELQGEFKRNEILRERGEVNAEQQPESMNRYALPGHKIVITQEMVDSMSEEEKEKIKNLEIGKVYTVEKTIVDDSHTDVLLKEIPNKEFNSVSFSDVEKQSLESDKQHPDWVGYNQAETPANESNEQGNLEESGEEILEKESREIDEMKRNIELRTELGISTMPGSEFEEFKKVVKNNRDNIFYRNAFGAGEFNMIFNRLGIKLDDIKGINASWLIDDIGKKVAVREMAIMEEKSVIEKGYFGNGNIHREKENRKKNLKKAEDDAELKEDEYSDFRNDVVKTLHLGGGNHKEECVKIKKEMGVNDNKFSIFLKVMEDEIKNVTSEDELSSIYKNGFDIYASFGSNRHLLKMINTSKGYHFKKIRKETAEKIEKLSKTNKGLSDELLKNIHLFFDIDHFPSTEETIKELEKY